MYSDVFGGFIKSAYLCTAFKISNGRLAQLV